MNDNIDSLWQASVFSDFGLLCLAVELALQDRSRYYSRNYFNEVDHMLDLMIELGYGASA